jgi:hypothetical protein
MACRNRATDTVTTEGRIGIWRSDGKAYVPGRWRPRRKTRGRRIEQTTSAGTAAARPLQWRLDGSREEECCCCW